MSDLKRYGQYSGNHIEEVPNGDYVKFEDITSLQAENKELREAIKAHKDGIVESRMGEVDYILYKVLDMTK